MKLSTRSRYGARILVDLARHNDQGPVQIGEISKRQDISVKYLEQLIRPLKQASMVTSVRGPKGGHLLAKEPEDNLVGPNRASCSKDKVNWLNVSATPSNATCPTTVR